jgi:hypothetical protein
MAKKKEPTAERGAIPKGGASADGDAPVRRRAKTIAIRRISKEELRRGAEEIAGFTYDRPKSRSECKDGERPCPYVACKHHLYLDVNPRTGSIKFNFPGLELADMKETCALDIADRGAITLEEIGEIMNLTRERVRQLEQSALEKVQEAEEADSLKDFL